VKEPQATPHPFANDEEKDEKMQELLSSITLDSGHYTQLYASLGEVVDTLNKYMVNITATKTNIDWLSNVYETQTDATDIHSRREYRELFPRWYGLGARGER
jgi:hypothetical protein